MEFPRGANPDAKIQAALEDLILMCKLQQIILKVTIDSDPFGTTTKVNNLRYYTLVFALEGKKPEQNTGICSIQETSALDFSLTLRYFMRQFF
jgi:hypothetical protein